MVISPLGFDQDVSRFTGGTVSGTHRIPVICRELRSATARPLKSGAAALPSRSALSGVAHHRDPVTTSHLAGGKPEQVQKVLTPPGDVLRDPREVP
jgi:hypothetical protein